MACTSFRGKKSRVFGNTLGTGFTKTNQEKVLLEERSIRLGRCIISMIRNLALSVCMLKFIAHQWDVTCQEYIG